MSVLITHACQYAGPGSVPWLLQQHRQLYAHDLSFANLAQRQQFEQSHRGAVALQSQTPSELVQELAQHNASVGAVVYNDVYPNTPMPIEQIPLDLVQASLDALLLFPLQLSQLLLPQLKTRGSGCMVFVTSARYLQPEPGFALATSVRAATTAWALALAREAAPHNIQVNVVAPNYLYSEAYYPKARFVDDPQGQAQIAAKVPLGRLGNPQEIGQLIAFLTSGKAGFVTGQVINFTGGWP